MVLYCSTYLSFYSWVIYEHIQLGSSWLTHGMGNWWDQTSYMPDDVVSTLLENRGSVQDSVRMSLNFLFNSGKVGYLQGSWRVITILALNVSIQVKIVFLPHKHFPWASRVCFQVYSSIVSFKPGSEGECSGETKITWVTIIKGTHAFKDHSTTEIGNFQGKFSWSWKHLFPSPSVFLHEK